MIFSIIFALCLCRTHAYVDVYTEDRNLVECGGAYSPSDDTAIDHGKLLKKVVTAQVAILFQSYENGSFIFMCSGFLVSRRHVLTTAHCVWHTNSMTNFEARIGHTDISQGQKYSILEIKINRGYEENYGIALMTLDRAVEDPKIGVLCLPNEKIAAMNLTDMGLSFAGWTRADNNTGLRGYAFYLSTLRVISNQECNRTYALGLADLFTSWFTRGITSDLLCVFYYGTEKEGCGGGDSGAPLMLLQDDKWYAVGIVAFGIGCSDEEFPIGANRLSSHVDWIRNSIHTCSQAQAENRI